MKAFITNGTVAWEIPRNIAFCYLYGYYIPWGDWFVLPELTGGWKQGECGEWRVKTAMVSEKEKVKIYAD
jgi:hypothetical protein